MADVSVADADKEGDDDENATPTKKKKATPGKAKGKKKPVVKDDEVDGMAAVESELGGHGGDEGQ